MPKEVECRCFHYIYSHHLHILFPCRIWTWVFIASIVLEHTKFALVKGHSCAISRLNNTFAASRFDDLTEGKSLKNRVCLVLRNVPKIWYLLWFWILNQNPDSPITGNFWWNICDVIYKPFLFRWPQRYWLHYWHNLW